MAGNSQPGGNDDDGIGGGGHDVVRHQCHDTHQQKHHNGDPPVQRDGHAQVAGEALAALKFHPEGVAVPQDAGNTCHGADMRNIREH